MTATIRTVTHAPTGDRYLVLKIDFDDQRVIAKRVLATQGTLITQTDAARSLPLADCDPVQTVPRSSSTLAGLWRSGVEAHARDRGHAVAITRTRSGSLRAVELATVDEAIARLQTMTTIADALVDVTAAVAEDRPDLVLRARRQRRVILDQFGQQLDDAVTRAHEQRIDAAAALGEDALLDLALTFESEGLTTYAQLALAAAPVAT